MTMTFFDFSFFLDFNKFKPIYLIVRHCPTSKLEQFFPKRILHSSINARKILN